MNRWALLCGVMLLFAGAASAQTDSPRVELFGGYSYLHVSVSGTNFTASANGGSGSVSLNPNSWLGLVADFGGYTSGKGGFNGTLYSYLFGPKVAYRTGRFTVFTQALFGGVHASMGSGFGSESAFATALGGGLDWNATEHIGLRLVQAEYVLSELNDGVNDRQNNARVSAGVVVRF
jgi:outer membrane immunogenic protein